ncbi:cation transporter [Alicyclobacillus vulcanalis]|uniref:Cation efflux family protein n=1 Tax=Alicyclobacillus vulcanalis TaxID=252246 RepID=A0A1N7KZM1_9BACL|nr:cation transporter [Alicyclobacillus vulcanalis]SIS66987.1 Cation efflux family protein [Alicyclobacillus vulcanalis]
MPSLREKRLRGALELELFSVGWITCEAVFSAIAAYRAGSLALSAFSVDSAIELVSGMLLVVRLYAEIHTGASMDRRHPLERWTSAFVALCLFALAAYVAVKSGQAIRLQTGPSVTWLGLAVALASSVITPWLAVEKLRYGQLLDSPALCGDAMCSFTCGYMSWTLLAGVACNDMFHWWWVDPLAACGILYFVVKEAWESMDAFISGEGHTHSHSH